jgi:cytochrome c553
MRTVVRVIAALGLVFVAWLLGGSKSREEVVQAPIVRLAVRHPWLTAGAMAMGALVIVAILVVSGVVPIKASSGHWRITAAFLDFAKTRSVSTHAWGIDAPALDDEALVLRGAGQYESACLPCHGGPGRRLPPVMAAMTPPPPELTNLLTRWSPEELFSIVKHGIKFTGMPGWPAQQRDDEVWAMVAFLRRMPQLDAEAYRRLVYGDAGQPANASTNPSSGGGSPAAPALVRNLCSRCHGADGTGRGVGAFPSLAGQRPQYLHASLRAFAGRTRSSGIMSGIATGLSDADMRAVSEYYGSLAAREGDRPAELSAAARGAAIASPGVPERDIPACVECHGPTDHPKNPAYPKLTGQHVRYLVQQLQLFQERRRGGSPNVTLMHAFVDRLRADDIRDVTLYYGAGAIQVATTNGPRFPGASGGSSMEAGSGRVAGVSGASSSSSRSRSGRPGS